MYYTLLTCSVAIILGLIIGSRFETTVSFILSIIVCVVLGMVFMSIRINGYKKKLLEELAKLNGGEVL